MSKIFKEIMFERLNQLLSRKTTIFVFLGLIIFLIILLISAYNANLDLRKASYKEGLNEVKPIEYDASKWYNQMPSALWNEDRSDYIFPSDRLRYIVILYQKVPYPIDIKSDMQIFVGGTNVTMMEKFPYALHLNSTHQFDGLVYVFLPHEGGTNEVRVNLRIINATNNVSLENKTEILKFDIQSQAIQLQAESNQNTYWGIILSVGTAIATVLVLIYQTVKLRNEKKQTIRPWIGETNNGIEIGKLYNDKDEFKLLKEWNEMTEPEKIAFKCTYLDWSITLKNFGQIPAFNVQSRLLAVYNLEPAKEKLGEFAQKFVIMPNNEYKVMFRIDAVTSEAIQNPVLKPYLCFDFKYGSSPSKQEFRYGFTASMTGGTGYKIQLTWDEKSYEKINSILLDSLPKNDKSNVNDNAAKS